MARPAKERACPNCGVITIKKPYENGNGKTSWARWDNARTEWHDGMLASDPSPCKTAQREECKASYHYDAETKTTLDKERKDTEMKGNEIFKIFAQEIEQYLSTKPDMAEVRAEMEKIIEESSKRTSLRVELSWK